MAKSNASEMLTSLDSLFTTQEQRDEAKRDSVQDIPIFQISDFPEHPFKVKQDEAMLEMAESVRQYGVLVPGLVRQLEDGSYQMVSGHRRKMASELAGRDTIPCIVRDLTDDEAVIIMVDSNLQRERVLPSEKAFAYKMKLDAMRRQAGRPSKENLSPLETNLRTSAVIAQATGDITESGSGKWNAESSAQGQVCPLDGPCAGAGFSAPPLHTSPPSYRLYRLKKRFPYKSISYRKQHPFSDVHLSRKSRH